MIVIFKSADQTLALVVESLLESAGIPFSTRRKGFRGVFGSGSLMGHSPLVGPVEILVPEEYADEAKALLQAAEEDGESTDQAQGMNESEDEGSENDDDRS